MEMLQDIAIPSWIENRISHQTVRDLMAKGKASNQKYKYISGVTSMAKTYNAAVQSGSIQSTLVVATPMNPQKYRDVNADIRKINSLAMKKCTSYGKLTAAMHGQDIITKMEDVENEQD